MTTSYERPRQTIEQQFASGTTNTFTPTLYATIVGPVYEMVEDEDQGTYISEEKEYFYDSVNTVDVRTSDAYEVLYPLTATLEEATILYDDTLNGSLNAYTFTDATVAPNDEPFDFELVSGEAAYLRFVSGTYSHTYPTNTCTLAAGAPGQYTLTSSVPIFYAEDVGDAVTDGLLDYFDAATPAVAFLNRKVVSVNAAGTVITFEEAGAPTPGATAVATMTTRAALISSEQTPKRIRTITDTTHVTLYTARDYAVYTITSYDILRKMELEFTNTELIALGATVGATSMLLPAAMQDGDSHVIESANVKLTYRALRGDKFETLTSYETATQLAEDYTVSEYNTAVWMVYLALEQSAGRPVQLAPLAHDHYFTNTLTAYQEVFDFIKEEETPFGIVPATMDPAIVSALKAHVLAASDEEWTNFRRGYVTHKLVTSVNILEAELTGTGYVDAHREGFTGRYLYDASFAPAHTGFITDGVEAGHYAKVTSWTLVELSAPIYEAVSGADAVVSVDNWKTANAKVVITTADPGMNLAGKTVFFVVGGGHDTSADTGIYSDTSRAGVSITTNQAYGALGYRVISSSWASGDLTLYLYNLGSATAADLAALDVLTSMTFYDGPLSLRDEEAILNQNILISSVNSENQLTAPFKTGWTGTYTGVRYDIVDVYSKDEQAENYAAYAEGLTERRMSVLYPDYFEDSNGVTWPAYFICAARAGWRSGHPAHEPMTNTYLSNSFFYKLLRTDRDKYFRDSQLDKMAAGGVEIYLQTVAGSAIKCRHQLTTDRSSILKQEETSTCAVDTACKMLKQVIKPLLGRYNIGPDLFSVLNTRIAGVRDLVTERPIANFGSILKSFEIATLAQDPNNADGLILEIDSVTQKPFNRIHTTMRIS